MSVFNFTGATTAKNGMLANTYAIAANTTSAVHSIVSSTSNTPARVIVPLATRPVRGLVYPRFL